MTCAVRCYHAVTKSGVACSGKFFVRRVEQFTQDHVRFIYINDVVKGCHFHYPSCTVSSCRNTMIALVGEVSLLNWECLSRRVACCTSHNGVDTVTVLSKSSCVLFLLKCKHYERYSLATATPPPFFLMHTSIPIASGSTVLLSSSSSSYIIIHYYYYFQDALQCQLIHVRFVGVVDERPLHQ